MLTLPSRSHSTAGSCRWLSNGSTRIECRGLTPSGGPPGRSARKPTTSSARPSAAAASPTRRPRRGATGALVIPCTAFRISAPVCHRRAGSFSSARVTACASAAGVSGRFPATGAATSARCLEATAAAFSARKGGRPVSISYATTPRA